jgi:hypothetical protein
MKKTCENCQWFECTDIDGSLLDNGYCIMQDLFTFVEDDDTCDEWVASKEREDDLKNGC